MPGFYALPWKDRERQQALSNFYGVASIPTLVLVRGSDGSTITTYGRNAVQDPTAFPWGDYKPPAMVSACHSVATALGCEVM